MDCTDLGAPEWEVLTLRNSSFDAGGCWLVFGSLAIVSLAIAVGLAFFGAWLILPFAGIEVAALFMAARCIARRAGDYERVAVQGDRITLEVRERDRTEHVEFSRCWARLLVGSEKGGLRLALRSHGREVEIGRHLGECARVSLLQQLRPKLAVEHERI